jgi:hemoglobin
MRPYSSRWLLAACLALASLAGPASAAEDKAVGPLERGTLDQRVYTVLRDAINRGADLYNSGNYSGCYHLYYGALLTVEPFLDHHPELQKEIANGLTVAEREATTWQGARILRAVLDDIRATVYPRPVPAPRTVRSEEPKHPAPVEPPVVFGQGATLWERLGGEKNLDKVVDAFMRSALLDPTIDFTRGGQYQLTAERTKTLKKQFIHLASKVSGGPYDYSGPSMRDAHKGMGITDDQFEAFVGHVRKALLDTGVRLEDADLILKEINRTRKDIVEVQEMQGPVTLWQRLGGEKKLEKVVDTFMRSALLDPKVDFARGGKYLPPPERVKELKKQFIAQASSVSGGPYKYTGPSMRDVHKGMGITDAQFDAFVGHIHHALLENGIRPEDAEKVLKEINRTRKDVVETDTPPPAAPPARGLAPEAPTPRQGEASWGNLVTSFYGMLTRPTAPKPPTLWNRLGGEENLSKVVDDFMQAALRDPQVAFTRGGKYRQTPQRAGELKKQFIHLASKVSGGPYDYSGPSMRDAHKGMGITDSQFDAFVGHVRKALLDHGVRDEDADLILKEINRTRKDVVEQ